MSGRRDRRPEGTGDRATRRLLLFVLLLAGWGGAVAVRLYHLQVEDHTLYAARAEKQQQRIVRLHASRGTIFDSRGRELAVSVQVDSAYAVPSQLDREVGEVAAALAVPLGLEAEQLVRLLESDREFVWLKRKLERSESQAVAALELEGVYFLPESKRYYPHGRLAAQVLGFVGTDNLGLAGLESAYDRELAGKGATRTVLRDLRGRFFDAELAFADAKPGNDLHLTLDASLQYVAEKELKRAVENAGAKAGSILLLDARDSAVLAMATTPDFDPNRFASFPEESWRNRAVMDAFEPGSTFKLIVAAAGLEHRLLSPRDLFDCEQGGVAVASKFIGDHRPFGVLTFSEVIALSSNVGVIKAARRIGREPFYRMIEAFGFGRPTGIDLPGESAGIVHPYERFNELAAAYAAFGMGLSVTPLQLANAYAAVARGGALDRPYVVRLIGDGGGRAAPPDGDRRLGRPISEATARSLAELLEGVVEDGTGQAAAVTGYRVAGKTGTAEKSDRSGYSETGRVASFVGFAPSSRPRLVVLVVLDEPRRSTHGGDAAAPSFGELTSQALLYLGVAPEREHGGQIARWLRLPPPGEDRIARAAPDRLPVFDTLAVQDDPAKGPSRRRETAGRS